MRYRISYLTVAVFLAGALFGASGLWVSAQGTRTVVPEGFEFDVTTPLLKYHFPKKSLKAGVFKGTWIAENVEEVEPNFVIDSAEARLTAEPVIYFTLKKPEKDWPEGLYRLEIRADGKLVHTEHFVIR